MQELDFYTRYLKEGDADLANEWLIGWNKNKLDIGMYPNTGLVLYNKIDHTPIYIGFVWIPETSNMAMIGFITRNPYYKVKLPSGIRKQFIVKLGAYCKELGKKIIITWTDNPFLVGDFKSEGYAETSNKCSELIAKIF